MGTRLAAAAAALAIAVAIALALVQTSPPQRSGGFEVALQDNAVFLQRAYFDRERAFALAHRLGASWLRATALWYRVARPGGWRRLDDLVAAAAAHGIRVELTLTGPAPADATGDARVGVFRPDPARFAAFAAAAARRFRGRVERYSIWNEPNFATWLRPQAEAPTRYRALYRAGYAAIKAANPAAQVLIGETAGPAQAGRVIPALRFIRAVACRAPCAPLRADGYAHHPYDFSNPPDHAFAGADDVTLGSLGRLTRTLDALARAGALTTPDGRPLDVYLTEFGYLARGAGALPAAVRGAYLARAFAIAAGAYPRVRQLLQYLLVEPPESFPGGAFDTGIVSQAGAPSPAFDALARWSAASRGRLER